MTITYTLEVSRARFWGFPKLLARWKGSIYRLMYRETCAFLLAYYAIAFLYRYMLSEGLQREFEKISLYCREFTTVVPITFVLGFYVTFVVGRWWQQYNAIPWCDRLALQISTYVQGTDERGRMIRRALIRYANLTALLTFQCTSTVVKQRFPTINHLVEAGLLTPEEKEELEGVVAPHGNWWVPSQWFCQLVAIARKEGRIHDDLHYKSLIDEMLVYRGLCGTVWSYDWISVPLVYTQVVTIAVYSFFFSCLFGRQYLYNLGYNNDGNILDSNMVDYYFPLFTIFQFVFYVGWLKVAESMICPFGEDDDDFDMNWIVDRNIQVSYLIVDKMFRKIPKLTKDVFWDDVDPELPYTQAAASHRWKVPFFGSTVAMNISQRNAEWDIPEHMPSIDEEAKIGGFKQSNGFLKEKRIFSKQNSMDAIKTKNRFTRDSTDHDDRQILSHDSLDIHEDDESIHSSNDDVRSNGSRLVDEKNKRRGLSALLLGFSRNTIASRFGSRNSVNSRTTVTRSPSGNLGRISRRRRSRQHSTASSPALSCHRRPTHDNSRKVSTAEHGVNEVSADGNHEVVDETYTSPKKDVHVLSESMVNTDNLFTSTVYTPISIEIPPTVKEEPETEANRSSQ